MGTYIYIYIHVYIYIYIYMGPCWCIWTHIGPMNGPHELGTQDPDWAHEGLGSARNVYFLDVCKDMFQEVQNETCSQI